MHLPNEIYPINEKLTVHRNWMGWSISWLLHNLAEILNFQILIYSQTQSNYCHSGSVGHGFPVRLAISVLKEYWIVAQGLFVSCGSITCELKASSLGNKTIEFIGKFNIFTINFRSWGIAKFQPYGVGITRLRGCTY